MDEQHRFRHSRSATTYNLVFVNYVLDAFNNGNQVHVIYTDFKKAVDRVNLIKILKAIGLGELLLSWFRSYLTNRIHHVKVFGIKYRVSNIPSGVPQGGHLSPILFALFINNIKHVIRNSRFLMFVDDLKIFNEIRCINDCH
jgi:hypothetical protein